MVDLLEFKDLYLTENRDYIKSISRGLLVLEKDFNNKEIINEIMRLFHSIKSSSAIMGFKKIAYLAHVLEDVFDYARNDILEIKKDLFDEIFTAVDSMADALEKISEGGEESNFDDLVGDLKNMSGVQTVGVGKSLRSAEGIPILSNSKKTKYQSGSVSKFSFPKKDDFVKIAVKRVDDLMTLSEEMLTSKMKLELAFKKFLDSESDEKELNLKKLQAVINKIFLQISDLQYGVMKARLVSLDRISSIFPRMIRSLKKETGKGVDFRIENFDLELDRAVIDKLREPLAHLIRNAFDHGVYDGGSIRLYANQKKGNVEINVEDDGRGIDWKSVIDSAYKKGIIENKDKYLKKLKSKKPSRSIANLLYNPLLTTKKKATQISGRGVGLSVVKEFVNEVGGDIQVLSPCFKKGGTRFTLSLPVEVMINNVVLINVNDLVFAVPFQYVERIIRKKNIKIKKSISQDLGLINKEIIPIVNLKKVFHLSLKSFLKERGEASNLDEFGGESDFGKNDYLLINFHGKKLLLKTDKVIRKQEVIIKEMPVLLRGVNSFSGITILGTGMLVLVVSIDNLFNS